MPKVCSFHILFMERELMTSPVLNGKMQIHRVVCLKFLIGLLQPELSTRGLVGNFPPHRLFIVTADTLLSGWGCAGQSIALVHW